MFWHLTALSASSPIESILDKEGFALEELLDEEDIIQECKALNSRLINFLRDRAQVEQLLRYIIEEPQEDADSKRIFKFPFIACEIFTCEIDVIFKTLVEEEELMNLLFSFLEPNRSHSALLAGYFSKVVICLMLRKTVPLMNYVQVHQHVFQQLVDLIGITSIMEVLVRLVGADDHMYSDSVDVMQWLTDSSLLEMIVDKLSPSSTPEVHANAAETLCTITRNMSSPLASKLSTPSFVSRIFGHVLDDSHSKSGLVSSLCVCISLLDPKRSAPSPPFYSFRGQHIYESPVKVNQETVGAMLPKLGDLLMLLNVSLDDKILPTTYGQLKPPLGKHRLKIVEFIAVLLKTGNEIAETELISSGTIQRVIDLFFEYPYNSALHHHIESIIYSCLESTNNTIIDHLFQGCDLLTKILQTDNNPVLSEEPNQPTLLATGRKAPRLGNLGHITRIANKIMQLANTDSRIQIHIQGNNEWNEWQSTALQERNMVENVYRWVCGRPTSIHDRNRDSDEDDINHDRDYDVAALANNLSQAFRYNVYDNDETVEGRETLGQGDEEGYIDDESAEVVISSLRLGDDQGSLFTNSNWFAFQDDKMEDAPMTATSPTEIMDEINLNESSTGKDDDVVVGLDEEFLDSKSSNSTPNRSPNPFSEDYVANEKTTASDTDFFRFESTDNEDLFADRPPEWVGWNEPIVGSGVNPFEDYDNTPNLDIETPVAVEPEPSLPNGTTAKDNTAPSLFEEDVEFVGVELDGSEKAMDKALKEGIVGEAGALKRKVTPSEGEKENDNDSKEFNDSNYWRVDQEIAVSE
ncbi:putative SIT4 phosphatase-associated protein family [Helianthus annuus]|uniref:Putative SIT4 phosphatase-associated family protein n=1 Tax=Helianthus annuus TaxID=4232 RepID=A0A251VPH6_HELAN|nr:serine/threonine-protein phosphatase 6 regulatory subunit 3 [Helianthus annuus]KAF5822800.1 putative SIT4 phosphatase-associated protein family [Helianthus annuus]KAJ0623620.1 putative SIT4 phosphatase-associated protein family [Helianthus annuus]KAJ0627589.1 putative SIT4 phosphatase-associated protein family [Helianthus annuus]KAJ0810317.1 putative SIT4 phosphatase-associated protein family [Helianthus annuus]KAJ0948814.1 putative SIT4 phosphatase-associated protein family [Helianthus ann